MCAERPKCIEFWFGLKNKKKEREREEDGNVCFNLAARHQLFI